MYIRYDESSGQLVPVPEIWYSPAGAFYHDHINPNIPPGSVKISEATWSELLEAQSTGLQIVAGPEGTPIAVERTETPEERAARLLAARDALLANTDWLVHRHRDEVELEQNTSLQGRTYWELLQWRQALRALPQVPGFPDVTVPPKPAGMEA